MADQEVLDEHAGAVHRRDAGRVFRFVVVVAFIAALVIVGFDNRRDVRIGYAVGDASAPVWIVLVASTLAGVVIGFLIRHRPRRNV